MDLGRRSEHTVEIEEHGVEGQERGVRISHGSVSPGVTEMSRRILSPEKTQRRSQGDRHGCENALAVSDQRRRDALQILAHPADPPDVLAIMSCAPVRRRAHDCPGLPSSLPAFTPSMCQRVSPAVPRSHAAARLARLDPALSLRPPSVAAPRSRPQWRPAAPSIVSDPVTSPGCCATDNQPDRAVGGGDHAAGKTMPGSLPPPELISPRPSGRSPLWRHLGRGFDRGRQLGGAGRTRPAGLSDPALVDGDELAPSTIIV